MDTYSYLDSGLQAPVAAKLQAWLSENAPKWHAGYGMKPKGGGKSLSRLPGVVNYILLRSPSTISEYNCPS